LQVLAENMGMKVEVRPVELAELDSFEEVGACGTAAVITPIGKVVDEELNTTYAYGDGINPGPVTTKLYETLVGIQNGDLEDSFGWTKILD
jgi:branched-chain amino acid aminotransferase